MYKIYGFFDLNAVSSDFLRSAAAVLPKDRVNRINRYKNIEDKKLSAISYLLCIYALYDCFSLKNPVIETDEKGKPFLPDYPNIHFNVSHCKAGCVCAVSERPIGIDIQNYVDYSHDVAVMVCSRRELEYIGKSNNKSSAFTKIWAMKESYLKMRGDGICVDLKEIDVFGIANLLKMSETEEYVIAVSSENFI